METDSVETISETALPKSNSELSDKQKKKKKKKRKSKNNDSHIINQNGKADEAPSSQEQKEGETEISTGEDQVQLPENCLSTLPVESCQQDSVSCEEPGATLPDANRNKRREKKKEGDAEKTTNEDQVHPPKNPFSNSTVQEESPNHAQDSCEKPGGAQLSTGSNMSKQEDSPPDATTNMTCPQRRKRKKKRDRNAPNESGADIHGTDAEVAAKCNAISEAEGSKSMGVEAITVANVVINSCLKSKDDTLQQREGTESQTQSPKAKKRKRRRTKTMEVCDPLGTSTKSGPIECMENGDENGGQDLMTNLASQRDNSASGEKSGFQNLGKSKENQKDEKTEVNENVLGADVCDVRSKKRKGKKKKKTSSVDPKTADMEVCDPSGNTLATIESGSVECLLDHSSRENVENCDGNAGEDFVGRATTSKTEKSATREGSGVQNSRKRKVQTEDENVESNQDALGEGVSDVGRKRQKRKRNKKKNCESVANMDHSNKKDVENYDGNADGEIVSKDPSRKIEDSATEEKSVQNVETTKNKNKDEKGEIDEDTLGAEGVSKAEVEAKKRKKNSVDYKPDNMEEKKDDVSIPRNDEEPEIDREKFETSLSSSVLIHDNVAQGVASLETELSSSVLIHDNVAQGVASLETEPSSSVLIHDNVAQAVASLVTEPRCSCEGQSSKKLVVFDFNGILADVVRGSTPQFVPDGKVSLRSVFRRPFVADFLNFCFERFVVGIWSSRVIGLDYMTNLVLGNHARNLLFCFDQNICTTTTFKTLENNAKPLFLKNLSRVWDRFGTCFTCGKRKYDETNTLLIDDSPDKALCNPPHTGIYPCPYQYTDVEDSALGPEGELRKYLERLAEAENVQKFVEENPIGQTAITETHKSWDFYSKVIERHN